MFKRPHHQRIETALRALNGSFLLDCQCYFAGGTAIVLALDEYRESADIDFMCASSEGYRALRDAVYDRHMDGLTVAPLTLLRELRVDQYGIRTFLEIDGTPIKFEIVREARISLNGEMDPTLGVPVLGRSDLYAEKLLANADRGRDIATRHRDIIDLAMMIRRWGPVPEAAWVKASAAYGHTVGKAFKDVFAHAFTEHRMRDSLAAMHMDQALLPDIYDVLQSGLAVAEVYAAIR